MLSAGIANTVKALSITLPPGFPVKVLIKSDIYFAKTKSMIALNYIPFSIKSALNL